MVDVFSKEKRHEVMSKIRSKDTKIEIQVRHWLYHKGIRYRKNYKKVYGKPDIAITKYKIAIFVHGCFWHGHEKCKYYHLPKSRMEYWQEKIEKNKIRDQVNIEKLKNIGWHVFIIWECQVKKDFDRNINALYDDILSVEKA